MMLPKGTFTMSVRLSKSKLIAFRQCPKRLWLEVHRPELRVYDDSAQSRFDTGYQIGAFAQSQYPDGVLIAPDNNLTTALEQTREMLATSPRKTLFEATFQADGILVRADLLVPAKAGWHMVEVKSSTMVKDYHVEDVAIQSWVALRAGLPLAKTSLQVVDSKWTYPGGNDYSGLLKIEPVDEYIAPLQSEVPTWLAAAKEVANAAEPVVRMGRHCDNPFTCAFQSYCESLTAPIQFPISWLPGPHRAKRARYDAAGYLDLREIPADDLSGKQRKVLEATINNEVCFEPLTQEQRKTLAGTRYYLDFETIGFTIPIWAGTRPYQQIPFQWSCHIETADSAIAHESFLDLTGNDPSRAFAESLIATLGKSGPIVVYNQGFEKGIMRALAVRLPDLANDLTQIVDRVVDLLPLAKEHYYHPSMKGSWSLKAVLPAIAPELDYANLEEVADGLGAQTAYREASHPDTSFERKAQLVNALREYCTRDTFAMIKILHYFCESPT